MKPCLICHAEAADDAPTCVFCGEASWGPVSENEADRLAAERAEQERLAAEEDARIAAVVEAENVRLGAEFAKAAEEAVIIAELAALEAAPAEVEAEKAADVVIAPVAPAVELALPNDDEPAAKRRGRK